MADVARVVTVTNGGPAGPGTIDRDGFFQGDAVIGQRQGGMFPRSGLVTKFRARCETAPAGGDCVLRLYIDGALEATATIADTTTDSADVTIAVTVSTGMRWYVEFTSANSAAHVSYYLKGSAT